MSISYHVFAARNASVPEVLRAVPALEGLTAHVENGWVWYQVPPWDVPAQMLVEAMGALTGPVLLATLHDYECWTLRLQAEGHMPFGICYEFSRLLLDGDEGGGEPQRQYEMLPPPTDPIAGAVSVADDFFTPLPAAHGPSVATSADALLGRPAELGLPIPDEVAADLRNELPDEATDALLEWICDEVLDALEEYDIPHDADEVDAILLGDAVSDLELETPDANLPRLLVALGMTEEAADWVSRLAEGDEGPLDEMGEARALREDLKHILAHSSREALQPLAGGPLRLPLDDLDQLVRVGWFCSHMVGCAIGFELPSGHALEDFPSAYDWLPKGNGARMTLYPGDFLEAEEERLDIVNALKALPEGSTITLWFGDDSYAVARQTYSGVREGKYWVIIETAPALDGARLRDALAFAARLQHGEPITVNDEKEFQEACDLSVRTGSGLQALPDLDGLTVTGDDDARFEIAVSLFRLRFRDTWDTRPVQKDEEREAEGYLGELEEMFGRMAIPTRGEALLRGEGREYFEPDVDAMDFDGKRELAIEALERSLRHVTGAGFTPAGNLYCSAHPFEFMRLYLSPDRRSLLMEAIGQLGVGYRSLLSNFGRAILITTTTLNRASLPHRGVMVRHSDDPAVETLTGEHAIGLDRLAREGLEPAALPGSLVELCPIIEDYYQRTEGAAPEIAGPTRLHRT